MKAMSQVDLEEALSRVGLQVRAGNLVEAPWSGSAEGEAAGNVAWAGSDMGIFVVDCADPKIVELDTLARKDLLVCCALVHRDGSPTDCAECDGRVEARGADMTLICVPQQQRFKFATCVSPGLTVVTVIVDLMSMMGSRGLPAATVPKSLLRMIQGRQSAMETFAAGDFCAVARDVAARRAMLPSPPAFYYEGKTLELVSALLSEISRRDALLDGSGEFDPGILDRLNLVKRIIGQAPHRVLDVDALARVGAMNRTKLRSAFKLVYGTTLSGYRSALMLQRADCALKQGASVKQAAQRAGYATTSSFIVAYKRRYGVCPGVVRRD